MTGLDTNVLIRYFVEDDPVQTPIAVGIVESLTATEPGWVNLVALAELCWTLRRTFRVSRAGVASILETLLTSRDIVLEQDGVVRIAHAQYLNGNADFADCLISASACAAGCSQTLTFDRIAARDAGMKLIE